MQAAPKVWQHGSVWAEAKRQRSSSRQMVQRKPLSVVSKDSYFMSFEHAPASTFFYSEIFFLVTGHDFSNWSLFFRTGHYFFKLVTCQVKRFQKTGHTFGNIQNFLLLLYSPPPLPLHNNTLAFIHSLHIFYPLSAFSYRLGGGWRERKRLTTDIHTYTSAIEKSTDRRRFRVGSDRGVIGRIVAGLRRSFNNQIFGGRSDWKNRCGVLL